MAPKNFQTPVEQWSNWQRLKKAKKSPLNHEKSCSGSGILIWRFPKIVVPPKHPKMVILVGKPIVVGYHFRKPPYWLITIQIVWQISDSKFAGFFWILQYSTSFWKPGCPYPTEREKENNPDSKGALGDRDVWWFFPERVLTFLVEMIKYALSNCSSSTRFLSKFNRSFVSW